MEFHLDHKKIQQALLERGKLFEQFHGYHYKKYKGFAIGKDRRDNDIKVTLNSRIIIDTFAYGKFNPNSLSGVVPLLKVKSRESDESDSSEYFDLCDSEDEDDKISNKGSFHGSVTGDEAHRTPLTNEQLMHCSTLLRGYAVKTKQWLSFFVDYISRSPSAMKPFQV